MPPADAVAQLKQLGVEELLLPVLIQLAVIVAVARLAGMLFRKLNQPSAVGEIAAGLLLGPSCFGYFFPELAAAIFQPELHGMSLELSRAFLPKVFTALAQIGLIFLLFMIGLEFDFSHLRWHGKATLAVSISGVLLPFALGLGVAWVLFPHLGTNERGEVIPFTGFALFLGVAMSITALPVLGRMLLELNINRTKLAAVVIAAAAAQDALGWILLATISGVVRVGFALKPTLVMLGLTVGFSLFMVFAVKPLVTRWARSAMKRGDGVLPLNALAVLLVLMFLCAIATSLIGIFAIFGAFLLGAVLSGEEQFRTAVAGKLHDLLSAFFLPIFFTYTGLRTDIGSIGGAWGMAGLVLGAAIFGKFAGCGLAAWVCGFKPREAAIVGAMMNTRALMELIVTNIGRDLGVIPPSVFAMLVIMALVTTVMTTPILLRLAPGTELEPYIRQTTFRMPKGGRT